MMMIWAAQICLLRCAALTKDEDFREREIILNCLANAVECIPDMQRCVTEAGSALRWHVERLLTKCGDVATCTLWTRIKTLIDELRELLFYCNDVAGDPTLPESTRRLSTPARLQEQLHTHGHPDSGNRLLIHGCGVL